MTYMRRNHANPTTALDENEYLKRQQVAMLARENLFVSFGIPEEGHPEFDALCYVAYCAWFIPAYVIDDLPADVRALYLDLERTGYED